MAETGSPQWRGYVNQLLYGLDINEPVPDDVVTRVSDLLIAGTAFTGPVEEFYQAIGRALASDTLIHSASERENLLTREYLNRLMQTLEARLPWPVPAFTNLLWSVDRDAGAPVVGRIPHVLSHVEDHLNLQFAEPGSDDSGEFRMVLRLRSGHVVVLRAVEPLWRPGVELCAWGDPAAVRLEFRELAGLEVDPVEVGSDRS